MGDNSAVTAPPIRFLPLPSEPGAPHLFSVDVEDYFQVVAFESVVRRSDWDRHPSRVVENTVRLLDLLASRAVHGTFFTLGWIARKYPALVRRIAEAGHEVASHGDWHRRASRLDPAGLRAELRDSKTALEDAAGQPCLGYRAPSFSIVPGGEWAFQVLLEEGFRYDSSLFPVRRPDYGYPGAPEGPCLIESPAGTLLEIPLATTRLLGLRLPAAGGGYLRQLPFALFRRAFSRAAADGVSAMFYTHPWEYDSDQPRLPCGLLTRIRHYRNLDLTWPRMSALLGEFRFTSVAARFADRLGPAALPTRVAQ